MPRARCGERQMDEAMGAADQLTIWPSILSAREAWPSTRTLGSGGGGGGRGHGCDGGDSGDGRGGWYCTWMMVRSGCSDESPMLGIHALVQ